MTMRAPIPAPPLRAPRFGLIASAGLPEVAERWQVGFNFEAESVSVGSDLPSEQAESCGSLTVDVFASLTASDVTEGDPIALVAAESCSTIGWRARDWQGRVRRRLAAVESAQLARELWAGAVTQAAGLANRYLADAASDTVTNGPTGIVAAVACLEAALADWVQPGMVHMPVGLLAHAAAAQVVRLDGAVWRTPMGHVVVPDAGYDGSGPGGTPATTSQWMYGTGPLDVLLGPVEVTPDSFDDAQRLAQAYGTTNQNDIYVAAWRLAAVRWPHDLNHFAAEVDVAPCLVGGAS